MISTWNVRGMNKDIRHREVSSYLHSMQVPIIALLETRVKQDKADRIRSKFGNKWSFTDNYSHHYNGRIWIMWKTHEIKIKVLQIEEQFIHVEVISMDNKTQYYATIVYAMNQIERRKILWEQIDKIGEHMDKPWIVMGDYNNVLTCQDRIGGNPVTLNEYKDLAEMMQRSGLYEAASRGCHYTWSNKHLTGAIYSRIDRLIGNALWFQDYPDVIVEVLPPSISDHAPIRVRSLSVQSKRKYHFKFLNCVASKENFQDIVRRSWSISTQGGPMQRLWAKLKRLQCDLRPLKRECSDIRTKILKARDDLEKAHQGLQANLFDTAAAELVYQCTNKLLELNQTEENILKQKAKVDWLRLGDGNNAYFHTSIRERHKHKSMSTLTSSKGEVLTNREDIVKEVLEFYKQLLGKASKDLTGVDKPCIMRGKMLSREDALSLIAPVTELEIWEALKGI
ncbi:uncharacterized protein LOC131594771 [Vicia villosa]|uniref:uncharacterized protein LOC131594771 n=1 Tax=Vicia villosa TaxID=3911 RepID=UPI00273CD194|nr:uncharacterized protein LOC131594771 [Vicia villosa]